MKGDKLENKNGINNDIITKIEHCLEYIMHDIKYYSKPKMKKLMTDKDIYFKRIIDLFCFCHNMNGYKAITPHPDFQEKPFSYYFF